MTFAIGGGAQCAAPCADRAGARLGPDVWLSSALARAGQIPGVRGFLYTGPRVSTGETEGPPTLAIPYARELSRYAGLLGASPNVFAAPSPTDLAGSAGESLFEQVFAGFPAPFGEGSPAAGFTPAGGARSEECGGGGGCESYYAMDSHGAEGTVRVIVLDDTTGVGSTQRAWLAAKLEQAGKIGYPAIVVGNADLNAQIAAGDPQAIEVAAILQNDAASAYFFTSPEENTKRPLIGAPSVEAFGSGTLGYVNFVKETTGSFLGASGFMLAQVHFKEVIAKAGRLPKRANVTVRLIPSIGELALEAKEGTLLRRSQAALFEGLARRPRAGNRAPNSSTVGDTDPYIPIPSNCVGTACGRGLFPEYTFSSSRPDIGDFVEQNLASPVQPSVLLDSHEETIHDSSSGLFCAYNAGTTIVTISAGGLSSSLPVTIQPGSVRRPCGTVRLKELPAQQSAEAPAPAPAPAGPAPASTPPAVPLPAPPVVPPAAVQPTPAAKPFFLPVALGSPVLAFVPPPVPTPARPTPPSGTSAVTSPVEAAEKEEEEEEATEQVSAQASAYRATDHEPTPCTSSGSCCSPRSRAHPLAAARGAGGEECGSPRQPSRRSARKSECATALVAVHGPGRAAPSAETALRVFHQTLTMLPTLLTCLVTRASAGLGAM